MRDDRAAEAKGLSVQRGHRALVCGCSLTYVPFRSVALRMVTMSPSSSSRFCIICAAAREAVSASVGRWSTLTYTNTRLLVLPSSNGVLLERHRKQAGASLSHTKQGTSLHTRLSALYGSTAHSLHNRALLKQQIRDHVRRTSRTQYGMYIMPSSAMNSSTPQCVDRLLRLFSTLNNIGYSMCSDAAAHRHTRVKVGSHTSSSSSHKAALRQAQPAVQGYALKQEASDQKSVYREVPRHICCTRASACNHPHFHTEHVPRRSSADGGRKILSPFSASSLSRKDTGYTRYCALKLPAAKPPNMAPNILAATQAQSRRSKAADFHQTKSPEPRSVNLSIY